MPHALTDTYAARLEETLPLVHERMERSASTAGRAVVDVRLVAVTKAHPLAAVEAALDAGLLDLGENRVGELEEKRQALAAREPDGVRPDDEMRTGYDPSDPGTSASGTRDSGARDSGRRHSGTRGSGTSGRRASLPRPTWHLIGHVQSRKARRAAELADLIHSVDSLKLGERLSRHAVESGRTVRVLAQVNTSGEGTKSGFAAAEALERVHELAEMPGLEVRGLMTMAPLVDDEAVLSAAFAGLRRLGERLRAASGAVGPELSMGMTNDLEIAIREGSTMVRIGTALFGERAE